MSETPSNLSELQQRFSDYARHLPATVSAINEDWVKLQDHWDEDISSRLNIAVHKLAGTAGNYGYDEVGRLAQTLNQILNRVNDAGAPEEDEIKQIDAVTSELTQLAEKPADKASIMSLSVANVSASKDLIYIVDDDADASSYIEAILRSAGYETKAFSSLVDFNQAMQDKKPDIVIMDIVFPEGNLAGVEAINQLETEMGESLPIIFISARGDIQARIRSLRAGGCAYITKPVDPEIMLSVVVSNSRVEQAQKKILVIDDDNVALKHFETLLSSRNYQVMAIDDPAETLDVIESFQPDIVVMDYHMPDYNGEELVKMLRQDQRFMNLSIIMVTGDKDPSVQESIGRISNTRFVTKPIDNEGFLALVADTVESAYHSQKLMLNILKEYPHGLMNLYYFYSQLESFITTDESDGKVKVLIYVAIDEPASIRKEVGLKRLADANKQISAKLLSMTNDDEMLTQFTEFAYLALIDVGEHSAIEPRLNAMRDEMKQQVFAIDNKDISVTVSIGAIPVSQKIHSVDAAINVVERSSIDAGKNGGDQICLQSAEYEFANIPEHGVGRAFMNAFKADGIRMQYQPVVNINSSERVYEAFTRFADGKRIIVPGQFMPYIEEYELEFEFNKKVIIAVTKDMTVPEGVDDESDKATVIIKLEPSETTMVNILDWFNDYLDRNQIKLAHNIVFSFRESWVLKNHDAFKKFMANARGSGFDIALEHVGLSKYTAELIKAVNPCFTKLAPDYIKELLTASPVQASATLNSLKETGSSLVASGVENTDTFAQLMSLGICYFQGYVVQQPVESLEFNVSEFDI